MNDERRTRIERKLRERLSAAHVEVVDESHLHVGHAGAASGAGHSRALVVSPRFAGLSLVAAQRLVYEALSDEMGSEIHALSVRTLTPERWEGQREAR
jgi:BolA protein